MTVFSSRPTLRLTPEQEAVVEHEPTSTLVVPAFAGTGKTSTLVEHAKRWESSRGLYLAFNRDIRREARTRFPKHVEVRTMHAYAHRAMGVSRYEDRLQKTGIRRQQLREAARAALGAEGANIPHAVLRSISWGFRRYLISDDRTLLPQHLPVPAVEGWEPERVMRAATSIVEYLMDFRRTGGPFNHDMYLKAFALEQQAGNDPQAPYSHVLIDESQDLNPVMIGIAMRFGVPLIIVGDTYQSIYAFRGAVSAMKTFAGPRLPLTQSWRFGARVASAANTILRLTSNPPNLPVRPNPNVNTTVHSGGAGEGMILARTNARLMELLMEGVSRPFFIAGGYSQFRREIEAAIDLWAGKPLRFNSPLPYKDRDELELEASEGGDPVAARLVKLLEGYGPVVLAATLERLASLAREHASEADIHLSTAHRSKGLEASVVTLMDDFWSLGKRLSYREYLKSKDDWSLNDQRDFDQELNLLYVAATRAKDQLFLPPELFHELQSEGPIRSTSEPLPQRPSGHVIGSDKRLRKPQSDHYSGTVKWDYRELPALISSGANLEARDASGMTALMWAAEGGRENLVRELLATGADVNVCSPKQQLFIAVITRNVQWLRSLLAAGADIDGYDSYYGVGRVSIQAYAAEFGGPTVVRALLEHVKAIEKREGGNDRVRSYVNAYCRDYVTVLHRALRSRDPQVVELLLDAGAEAVNEVAGGAAGDSLLGFAATYPSDVMIHRLLEVGADPNLEGPDSPFAPLLTAVRCNRPLNVIALVEGGADLENRGEDGRTALMYAAHLGFKESLVALIELGAHLNRRDHQGLTALMLAARKGSMECIEALLEAGADARARTLRGVTAFDLAARHKKLVGTDVYWSLNDARYY